MLVFIAGALVGVGIAVMIIGFLAVALEDQERVEQARRKKEQDRKKMREIEDWYRSYD